MFDALLESLKTKLTEAYDFGPVLNAFFDITERPGFLEAGKQVQNAMLESVIQLIGKQIFGRPVPISGLLLHKIKEHHFIHGGFMVQGNLSNLFYFEDIDVGLVAIAVPGSETRVARFSSETFGHRGNGHGGNGSGNGNGNGHGGEHVQEMTPEEKRRLRKRLKDRLEKARSRKKKRG